MTPAAAPPGRRPLSLWRSAAIVSSGTAVSRVLGLVREMLMAWFFGTSLAKSAFDVAFRIPNMFRCLFGEGALSAAFVPVFTESLEKEGAEDARRLAGAAFTLLAAVLAALVGAGVLLATAALHFLDLGERMTAVLPLLRIMLPYTFFICLVALCMGMLNACHHFLLPAFTPVILNLVWILFLLVVCPMFGGTPEQQIYGAAWGTFVAGLAQLAVQVPAILRVGLWPRFSLRWNDPRVRQVLTLMAPATLGMGVHQVNLVLGGLMALWAGTWAPAALTYAERLIYLPLGLIGTSLSTVLLPTFSRHAVREEHGQIRETLDRTLRAMMFLMVPAAVGLMALAGPIVELAFRWKGGEFDDRSTMLTARAVAFYGPGLLVFNLNKILVPVFYALKDTRTPVRTGIVAVVTNFVLSVLFVLTWPAEYKHAGLALASVLSSAANSLQLAWLLHQRIGDPGWRRIGGSLARATAASLGMGAAACGLHRVLAGALAAGGVGGKWAQAVAVSGSIAAGMLCYAVLAAFLCRREVRELLPRLRGRRRAPAPSGRGPGNP